MKNQITIIACIKCITISGRGVAMCFQTMVAQSYRGKREEGTSKNGQLCVLYYSLLGIVFNFIIHFVNSNMRFVLYCNVLYCTLYFLSCSILYCGNDQGGGQLIKTVKQPKTVR